MELLVPHGGALPPASQLGGAGGAATVGIGSFKPAVCVSCRRTSRRWLFSGAALLRTDSPLPSSGIPSFSAADSRQDSALGRAECVVDMEEPPADVGSSRAEVVDYYVGVLAQVLGDEKEAQACIYDASWQSQYRFRCEIDEEAYGMLAGFPTVLAVRRDADVKSNQLTPQISPLRGGSNHWLVRMRKPGVEIVTRAQIVDYYADNLAKILKNEKEAQASIYHISWENDFGFCCQINEEHAQRLSDLPEVLSILRDDNIDSKNKNYGGDDGLKSSESSKTSVNEEKSAVKTKRLFIAGLSFYTSEKTLRAAFEGFGELVEVKIIMDNISKRSKGYAFIEYATEEAAAVALKEMNGKLINGWMIVVDVARSGGARRGPPSST